MSPFNRRLWAVIVFTTLLIGIVNLAWWFFYDKTERSFEKQLSRRLASVGQIGAASIDAELIGAVEEGALWAYDDILDVIERIKEADSLSEVFIIYADRKYLATTSLYIDSDSTYYLAALNSTAIDSAFAMESRNAWAEGTVRPIVTDGYEVGGLLLKSAFVPLFDESGLVVAVLGVEADVDYTDDLVELKNNLYLSSGISIGVGILFALLFFLFQRRIGASEKSLLLAQSQANLGRMVAVVSHEIKNPLMIIRASAESINKRVDSPESRFILEETDRLNRIVSGYLDFASGKISIKNETIKLKEFTSGIVDKFAPRLGTDGVRLEFQGDSADPRACTDPVALRQVLINLILNGAEAVKENGGGLISVKISEDLRRAKIEVTDNGPGIDRKNLKNIFEAFYTTKTTGSGLGLFHSRRLLEKMGGDIAVDSRRGGPTTFIVMVPLAEKGE